MLLELTVAADAPLVHKAFKKACLKHHPDKGGSDKMFLLLQEARNTLSNEAGRYFYDVKLRRHYLEMERAAAKPEP